MDNKMLNAKISYALMQTAEELRRQTETYIEDGYIKRHTGNGWNDWSEYVCPSCGEVIDGRFIKKEPNFCPNCGKAMR